jgi:hypothetical protein
MCTSGEAEAVAQGDTRQWPQKQFCSQQTFRPTAYGMVQKHLLGTTTDKLLSTLPTPLLTVKL